jgi:hypothetical protein
MEQKYRGGVAVQQQQQQQHAYMPMPLRQIRKRTRSKLAAEAVPTAALEDSAVDADAHDCA